MSPKNRRRPTRYVNRNRQWGARQNTFSISLKSSAAIVAVVIVLVCRLVGTQARDAMQGEIQSEETRRQDLLEQLAREKAKWTELRAEKSLAHALDLNGVVMSRPGASRCIAMSGRVSAPGTISGVYAANR